ncbi:hypothetical protein [Candidatus Nitrosotalea bavarica]|uniref:hypothetical protein n=1 Tax=Candidatus Nitrosotalea bavarica TaxID=1903277 RepID=UPI000C70168C|nr:hypothetical protein [Candidatus Nitrosotalea bavarica]
MQKKLLALLFVTAVLTSSFAASVLPMASALTQRTVFNDNHSTASYGGTNVCGDHICASGEKTQWLEKLSQLQRTGPGKIANAYTYLATLSPTSNTTPAPTSNTTPMSNSTSVHGNLNMAEKMNVGENMTSAGNMTKGTK